MNFLHHFKIHRVKSGFTLIEILLAIGILAILATAAIIAINPARQFADARNTQRWSDVNAIANAIYQYGVNNKGAMPSGILAGDNLTEICATGGSCSGLTDLSMLTEGSKYLTAIPVDPSCPTECAPSGTGYVVALNGDGRVHVKALGAENSEIIELIR